MHMRHFSAVRWGQVILQVVRSAGWCSGGRSLGRRFDCGLVIGEIATVLKEFPHPKTRSEWWAAKSARNKARDLEVCAELQAKGWWVMVIWECEAADKQLLEGK